MPGAGHDPTRFVSMSQVVELIAANITSGHVAENNSIKYYAMTNRDFAGSFFATDGTEAAVPLGAAAVVELFPMWGTLDRPVIDGEEDDLMYIAFHVVTALANNTVYEEIFDADVEGSPLRRTLNRGDQLVRWYIPSVFIPQRTVDPDTSVLSGNRLPVRVHYRVGLNSMRVNEGISPAYIAANSSGNNVFFYSNRPSDNVTFIFYRPHKDNPFYNFGRPGEGDRAVLKSENLTATARHVTLNRHIDREGEGRMDLHWLGNNGRLTVTLDSPPGPPGPPRNPPGFPPGIPPSEPPGDPPAVPPDEPPDYPPDLPPDASSDVPPDEPPIDHHPDRPPGPPPGPQTGDERQTSHYITALIVGLVLMGCPILYKLRERGLTGGGHIDKHITKRR